MAERVCPVWIGYLLLSPVRKLFQNPNKILSPYVKDGMKVMDVGSAMGYFSLELANLVGKNGKIICVDMQQKMLDVLKKRAGKVNLLERIETRLCSQESLGVDDLKEKLDFVLAFAMVHEVPDAVPFLKELSGTLKRKGLLLISEPAGHVIEEDFKKTISIAEQNNLKVIERPNIKSSLSALLQKE
jgi:ubiquinone/menaquinone biosynthesis C-methylase UbiE